MSTVTQKQPFVSIIVVNYNGRHLMDDCLGSLKEIDYPSSQYEVIVVDNDSDDDSVVHIRRKYPWVKLIEAGSNTGFAGGNNFGLKHANPKYKYVVLLNSDTRVDPRWLKELVSVAKKNKNAGLVSSKLLYNIPFIEFEIKSDTLRKSDFTDQLDFSPMGVMIEEIKCSDSNLQSQVWYKSGFYQPDEADVVTRWTKGNAKVLLPFDLKNGQEYQLTIHGYPTADKRENHVEVYLGKSKLMSDTISNNQVEQYQLKISPQVGKRNVKWLVQNSGNKVLKSGYGKDRGSMLHFEDDEAIEFYEPDSDYFSHEIKLEAACGASLLIKREVVEKIELFDGHYFMYYEDMDLSLRAWRSGWDIVYAPQSIVYHKHRASTGREISPFFLKMTEANHLYFLTTHFPLATVFIEFAKFVTRLVYTGLATIALRVRQNVSQYYLWRERFQARYEAMLMFLHHLPKLIKNRMYWNQAQTRDITQRIGDFY